MKQIFHKVTEPAKNIRQWRDRTTCTHEPWDMDMDYMYNPELHEMLQTMVDIRLYNWYSGKIVALFIAYKLLFFYVF